MPAATPAEWAVLPHDALTQLADNLWQVEGDLPGMPLRRRMVVARLRGGDLVLHNAVALDEPGMAALEALGRPAWMVVPNGWHRIDAARFKTRYPGLRVVCPADARKAVSKVVPVDATYDELPQPDAADDSVRFEHFGPGKRMEGAMLVRSEDGVSAVFADALMNLPYGKGLWWYVYGRLMGNAGGPRVTTIGRAFMGRAGRAELRDWFLRTADSPGFVRAVPCHGGIIGADAAAALRGVAATL